MKRLKIPTKGWSSFGRKDLGLMILFFALFVNHYSFIINPVHAEDATPSADIQLKLQQLEQEIASKAAELKQNINSKLQNRTFVGIVKSKTTTTLTLATKDGTKLVNVNQDTNYYSDDPKVKKYSLTGMKEEDRIAAMGDVDDTGVLTAREIDIEPTEATPKTVLWGQVLAISDNLATIKDRDSESVPVSLVDIDTNPKLNDLVIITGIKNKNNIIEASFVYTIPQKASPSASPSTSPSPSPKSSPKASLKPTPKPTK